MTSFYTYVYILLNVFFNFNSLSIFFLWFLFIFYFFIFIYLLLSVFLHPTKTFSRKRLCLIVLCISSDRWIHFPRNTCLSRQNTSFVAKKYTCRNKRFVATKLCLSRQNIFVATKVGPTSVATKLGRQECVVWRVVTCSDEKVISSQDCRIIMCAHAHSFGGIKVRGRKWLKWQADVYYRCRPKH